jgi:hypothetical protein
MKRFVYIIMMAATLAACSNRDDELSVGDGSPVAITFAISGDFTLTSHDFTRSLTADGKDMTDVWVLDYVDGTLVQQLHQSDNTAADFGTPTMNLAIGTHHIYFVASRGFAATLNTDDHTLIFGTVRDTFWKDYAITITSGTASSSRSVTLDRVVTKLKVVFSDAIPAGATTFNITPATWYYGINYTTGEPISATPSQPITVNIPSSEIGLVNEAVSIFGFSSATEWTTDIAINCKAANNDVLGSATITSAPFVRNRVSEYTGPLFGDSGAMTLSLNATWDDSYNGTW